MLFEEVVETCRLRNDGFGAFDEWMSGVVVFLLFYQCLRIVLDRSFFIVIRILQVELRLVDNDHKGSKVSGGLLKILIIALVVCQPTFLVKVKNVVRVLIL